MATPAPIRGMVGSHLSIAGGMFRAIEEARRLGFDCVQVFTKNQRQWRAPPLSEDEVVAWRRAVVEAGWDDLPGRLVSHNSYLVNLASPDPDARARSVALQREEIERCERLGIPWCVTHPGAHLGAARTPGTPNVLGAEPNPDERAGLERIARSLDEIHAATPGYRTVTCLENTVGSGTNLGFDFAHLRAIRDLVREPGRVAFCFDTCHATAAGYDLSTPEAARATLDDWDRTCGRSALAVFHLNDSLAPRGSRKDLHAHIGEGTCGIECFRAILVDAGFALVPKILETAKDDHPSGEPWDAVNARRLRSLLPGHPGEEGVEPTGDVPPSDGQVPACESSPPRKASRSRSSFSPRRS